MPYYILFWQKPGELANGSLFADTRQTTSALECNRSGHDVLIANPCDPWKRPFDYPRIWMALAPLQIDQSHTVFLGILSGILFFTSAYFIIGFINIPEVIVYLLILLSPSVLLAVERGNNDLIIFSLLALATFSISSVQKKTNVFGYVVLFLAAVLKLYPIMALVVVLKEKGKRGTLIFISVFFTFLLYLFVIFNDIQRIVQVLPTIGNYFTYGISVSFDIIEHVLTSKVGFFIEFLTLSSLLVLIFSIFRRRSYFGTAVEFENSQRGRVVSAGFLVGAGIYLGTYILGRNYDYRLIFLIFLVPQLLIWIKDAGKYSISASAVLLGVIFSVWLSRWSQNLLYIDEIINFLLFLYFFVFFSKIFYQRIWLDGLYPNIQSIYRK